MSANSDEPGKRSGYAGVHTNPTRHQPLNSTSIHDRNTAGNHEGYSSSISEQSISGQNRNMYVGNTLLGIGRGRPSHRDDTINTIQTDDGGNDYTTGSFQTSQRDLDSSSDTDTWFPLDCSDTSSQQDKLDRSVMFKGQNAPVTDQEKLNRSVILKERPDTSSQQDKLDRSVMFKGQNAPVTDQEKLNRSVILKERPDTSSQQDKLDRSVMFKGQNAPVTDQEKLNRSVILKERPDVKPDQGAIPKVKPAGSSNDPQQRNEGEKKMNQTCRQDSQDSKDVFDVVRGKLNPSALKRENEVRAECIKQGIKYDGDTMEVEGTLRQLTSLNQYFITSFGEKMGLLSFGQKQETLTRKTRQAPYPNQQHDDIEHKIKIKLTDMEYKMLKFYCPVSVVFKRKCKYKNDMLIIYPGLNETEQEFKLIIQSKLPYFNSMMCFDVVPQNTTIDDDQLRKIEQQIPPDIFCYLSKDRKTLTLKGSNYEMLSVAKNKSEFILGLPKKNNNYESRKDKTPKNRSFHQSINYSRSSSESVGGSSRTYNSSAVKDLSYLTPEGLVVKVYVGSILHLNVDCIVNAANENLIHAAGVADIISRAAGYGFQKESDDYIQNNGPLSVTECCTTSAGNLQQYQCVIHAVGPKWHEYPIDKRAFAHDLQKTIVNCFKEAEVQKVSSVALSAISSGIYGVPKEVCCSQYCKAVIEYSNTCGKTTCLKEIYFMDKEPEMIQMIHAEFSLHLNMTQSASASGNTGPNPSTGTTATRSRDGKSLLSRSFSDDPDIKHHHDNPSSGNSDTNKAQTIAGKFQKQYIAAKDLRINIVQEDIKKMTVDIIVWPQDELGLSKEGIPKAIPKDIIEWYSIPVLGKNRVKRCEVKEIKVSPASLPFKEVLYTVAPQWDNHAVKNNKTFEKKLKLTIRNIVQHCSVRRTVNTVAIPVLGIGADGLPTPYVTYASILANEISKAMKSDKFSLAEIYIVTNEWSMASDIADHFDTVDSFTKVPSFKGQNRKKDKDVVKAGDKEQSKDDL